MLFDKEMSPLGFESHDIFNFILRNFEETELIHHENALEWLQVELISKKSRLIWSFIFEL